MRGFLEPATRQMPTESQDSFRGLSRSRRTKLAKAANTTLLKADQWARGDATAKEIATALDHAFAAHAKKKK